MFCSFLTMPRIMRFFCMGKVIEWDQPEFESLIRKMGKEKIEGARAIILLDVFKVGTTPFFGTVDVIGVTTSKTAGPDVMWLWSAAPQFRPHQW